MKRFWHRDRRMKSVYLSPLTVTNINDTANDGRGVWRVDRQLIYYSALLRKKLVIERGFLTDFASVPRLPFIYWWLGDSSHKAAVIHDWLFHHHEVCDEQNANRVLLEASKVEGIPWYRRMLIYVGVKIGGASSWEADGKGNGHTFTHGRIV